MKKRGIFAIRGPARPNPVRISVARLKKVEGNILIIQNIDIVDGTPLIDIKPFVPEFDSKENVRLGWLEKNMGKLFQARDDGRFAR